MNRREFCKTISLATLGALLPARLLAMTRKPEPLADHMPKCCLTVLRCECFSDLQSRYLDDPESGPCPIFSAGRKFTVSDSQQWPEGFCPKAWESVRHHVAAILTGTDERCGASTADRSVIACCSDGTRPVIFKITPL